MNGHTPVVEQLIDAGANRSRYGRAPNDRSCLRAVGFVKPKCAAGVTPRPCIRSGAANGAFAFDLGSAMGGAAWGRAT